MGRKLSTFWCQLFRSILLYKEKERCLAFSDKNSSLSAKGRAYINLLSVDFAALILSALHIQRCGIILTSLSSFNPLLTVSLDFFYFFFPFSMEMDKGAISKPIAWVCCTAEPRSCIYFISNCVIADDRWHCWLDIQLERN